MNMTYLRVALYFLAPLIGLFPGVKLDQQAMTVTIDLATAAIGVTAAGGISGAIFQRWGKK
jgi:hypothetical protein